MNRGLWTLLAATMLTAALIAQTRPDSAPQAPAARGAEQARETIDTYCVGCHNSRARFSDTIATGWRP